MTICRPRAAPRKLTLAEQIEAQIDRLNALLPAAHNDARGQPRTDELLDDVHSVGRQLCRIARG